MDQQFNFTAPENPLIVHGNLSDPNVVNILLIESGVKDKEIIINSVNVNTVAIIYSSSSKSEELLAKLGEKSFDRMAIVFNNYDAEKKKFLDNKLLFDNYDLLVNIIGKNNIKNLDFLACDTLSINSYRNFYNALTVATNVIIGASDDKTGNLKQGGDFILETTNEDIKTIYFTENIGNYTHLLDGNPPDWQRFKISYMTSDGVDSASIFISLDIANYNYNDESFPGEDYITPSWINEFTVYNGDVLLDYTVENLTGIIIHPQIEGGIHPFNDPNNLTLELGVAFWAVIDDTNNMDGLYYNLNSLMPYYDVLIAYKVEYANSVCFLENTLILTNQGYIKIQDLQEGQQVKTSLAQDEYKKIWKIKSKMMYNQPNIKTPNNLYLCPKDKYPGAIDDLYITGYHSLLVDKISAIKAAEIKKLLGNIYITDKRYRLPVYLDEKAGVYNSIGHFKIYHFALENTDRYMNYGIWANGILTETCSKRFINDYFNEGGH